MPRAEPFTRSDVSARERVTCEPDLIKKIDKILEGVGIKPPKLSLVSCQVQQAIRTYKLRICADSQERPARIAAVLKQGLPLARQVRQCCKGREQKYRKLSEWLDTLPRWLHADLKASRLESLPARIEQLLDYWQGKVRPQRPAGKADARVSLVQSLDTFLAESIDDERKRRQTAADILAAATIKFPDEKKNRSRFTGMRRPK